jgi:lipopolysaccharide export system protein LptC
LADLFAPMLDDLSKSAGFQNQAFAKANRHSKWVRFLKFALPASALFIVAGFGLVAMQARMLPDEIGVAAVALEGGKIVMDSPRLNGMMGDNQPYTVEARRALQAVGDVNDIDLEYITAQLPIGDGKTAKLVAPAGHLDNGKRILTLKGNFDFVSSDGMVAKLENGIFDFNAQSLKTEMPVDIKRPGTHIRADSMTIFDGGNRVLFEKRVRMIMQPQVTQHSTGQLRGTDNGG